MPPEQKEKTREEIVQDTGWGFLVRGTNFSPPPKTQEKPALPSPDSSQDKTPVSPTSK
jgi:hypothetical protein